jgi:hypothetical protein
VPNWSISRHYKNIWNSTKDSVTTEMPVTQTTWGQTTGQRGTGVGRLAGDSLSQFSLRFDGYAPKLPYKSFPCLKVSGDLEEWAAGHMVGRPAVQQL